MSRGVLRTNIEKCRGCYTCIRHCPVKAIRARGGRTEIIEERCIGCGNCVRVCPHGAIEVSSMVPAVREFLSDSSECILVLGPTFPVAFSNLGSGRLVAAAKHLGFQRVVEGAFGIDLIAPRYQELFAQDKQAGFVSTACPAAYCYVCRYAPALVPRLMPVVSPMIAIGRYLKGRSSGAIHVVYATGGISGLFEMLDPEVAGAIDAVVTFQELRQLFGDERIIGDLLTEEPFDEPYPLVGRWYPVAGARSWILGFDPTVSPEEVAFFLRPEESVRALRDLCESGLFLRFMEACFSERGLAAPFVSQVLSPLARRHLVAEYARSSGGKVEHARRVGRLEPHKGVDLERGFEISDMRLPIAPDQEILRALERLEMHTPEDRLNCGACGYDTCWEGAIALTQGLADEHMCLPYLNEKCRQTSLELRRANRKLAAAQEQLVHAEKLAAMGQLAAGVAHEINNPLGTVLIYGHLLKDRLEDDDSKKADVETIVNETERCRKIVSGLLNFARQSKLNLAATDARRLLEDSVEEAEVQHPDHGIDVRYEIAPDLPRIELDPDQMKQVFLNIVVNALEAMEGKGRLTLGAHMTSDGHSMRLTVSDTGPGIPKEDVSKLFQPFFTTKPIGKGTGLGLAIAYGIVKMHRGGIEVHSEVGKGTAFTITLPMKQEVKPEQIVGEEPVVGGEPQSSGSQQMP